MTTLTSLINPYWDAVRDHIDPTGSLWGTPSVDGIACYRRPGGAFDVDRWVRESLKRTDYVKRYAWTITDPDTVAFVAEHSRGRLVDPMAGTGYWAWMLTQAGVDVVAYDRNPPAVDRDTNHYHRNVAAHSDVSEADAKDSVALHPDRTLLLSWPPYGFNACPILDAYKGTSAPAMMDLAGLTVQAQALRDLRRIVDLAAAQAAGPVVRAGADKAHAAVAAAGAAVDAAGAAVVAAAAVAAAGAAVDAAGAAAVDAARAAVDAARAAGATAVDAAVDAVDAAWAALKPTVDQLQDSAITLFTTMIRPEEF